MMRYLMFTLILSGCAAPVPGDGRLVVVDIDPSIASVLIGDTGISCVGSVCQTDVQHPVSFYVDAGLHYWDAVGARLRLRSEIGNELPAATLTVVRGGSDAPLGESPIAWWSQIDGNIHVTWPMPDGGSDEITISSLFAHEAGHALGLNHILDQSSSNVMAPIGSSSRLGPLDIEQFNRIHGR